MSTLDTGYPAHRAADVVLADGAVVHLRPIRPDDADAVVALHSRFSDRTRYLRYFSPYPRIPQRDLRRFVEVDHHDREALVAQLGDQLIAVARYDRTAPDEAEVAFVVEDAYQGRGLGSVLLEHLAAAATSEGIARFVAEVLPENGAMQRVLVDTGYQMERSYSDGVMHFSVDLTGTERAIEVARSREQYAVARSIARVLHPRSVAVVGASTRPGTIGDALLRNLRAADFTGPVYPVHPTTERVQGLRAYPAVAAIGKPVDLALVATPAATTLDVIQDCAAAGVGTLVVVSAGFGEAGEEGRERERRLVRTAHRYGMRVVGPNCFGVANTDPQVRLNATLAPRLPRHGRVGFFCQSGAFGIALLASAEERGLGLSTFVSAGNRADVSGNDLLQYWRSDPATDVVLLYLETFGNPRKFARVARQLARRKPVVTVANRGSAGGVRAVEPGRDVLSAPSLAEALFAQHGVIRVDTVGELFDVGLLLAYQPLPAGNRVAVVGNSTALGRLAADACRAGGLRVPDRYPVDVGPEASAEAFAEAVGAATRAEDVDAIVAVFVPPLAVPGARYADVLLAGTAGGERPVVATFVAPGKFAEHDAPDDDALSRLRKPGPDGGPDRGTVPAYPTVEEAVRALSRVAGYAHWLRQPAGTVPQLPDVNPDLAREVVVSRPGDADEAVLTDGDAGALLAGYGVGVVDSRPARSPDEAVDAAESLGYPVALKVRAAPLRARLDLGAVRLDLAGAAAVSRAYSEVAELFGAGVEVLVQPMRPPGVACRVRVAQDPAFGPVVGFGLGGAIAELLGDEAWRAAPLTDADAAALVRETRGAPMLFGYRGTGTVDVSALEDLLVRVGLLVDEQPQVHSLELNPVLVTGSGLSVLHASVVLGSAGQRPDTGPRRL